MEIGRVPNTRVWVLNFEQAESCAELRGLLAGQGLVVAVLIPSRNRTTDAVDSWAGIRIRDVESTHSIDPSPIEGCVAQRRYFGIASRARRCQ